MTEGTSRRNAKQANGWNSPTVMLTNPLAPELLAPAGDMLCAKAAVENGADAVYFGLDRGFNARVRATNISFDSLPELMSLLHGRRVKGYVTLNTLVFSNELREFERTVRTVAEAGVDAVLVQDVGMVRVIKEVCPELAIHASTQMTMTSAECIAAIEPLGVERVVLARELSIGEIQTIANATKVELEVFAHGALCVAYSGQCMTSESLGGRSANRGHCAQACRLPYELTCDGVDVDLGLQIYLLSPQDLAAFDLIPQLIEAGVRALKIEGRLKTPEYVANITRHYRNAIDAAVGGREKRFTAEEIDEMELSFSRGFSPGWLQGCDHKMLVPALSSAKRGVWLGTVQAVNRQRVTVRLQRPITAGDGVVFEGDRANDQEQGGRVFELFLRGQSVRGPVDTGLVELSFREQAIDFAKVQVGTAVWKTDDPRLTSRLRKTFQSDKPQRKLPIEITARAKIDKLLQVDVRLDDYQFRLESDDRLAPATKHAINEEVLRTQLGRLGNTRYKLDKLTATIDGAPMVPLSVLGKIRREMVRSLDSWLSRTSRRDISRQSVINRLRPELDHAAAPTPTLRVLCRSLRQLAFVVDSGVRELYVDFPDIREYADAVRIAHQQGCRITLATPRIHKPGETGILRSLLKHEPDAMLVRNFACLRFFRKHAVPIVGDFSLNVANEITAADLMQQGLQRVTASYDLNRGQLIGLVRAVPKSWLEIVIHQHMPMFHMEHCVFCAVLSPGTNKTNCGRPCDDHNVKMRDRVGMEHTLTADVGCRNTLFNAKPQSGAEAVPQLLREGITAYRVELLGDETKKQTTRSINLYCGLLEGRFSAKDVWSQLRASNRVGVTRGSLEDRKNPLEIL